MKVAITVAGIAARMAAARAARARNEAVQAALAELAARAAREDATSDRTVVNPPGQHVIDNERS